MRIIEKIKSVTNEPFYQIEEKVGLARGTIYRWDKYTPSATSVAMVARYLGVSTDFLLNEEEDDPTNIYPVDALVEFDEIGSVCAGYDSTVDENPTGKKIEIAKSMLNGRPPRDYFVLRVKGNSMYPRMLEGDDILCLRCTSVDSGDYAVVLYNGDEATVKQVHYVYGQNWLELIPANPEYQTKRIEGVDLKQCRVIGKVVKLIRDF